MDLRPSPNTQSTPLTYEVGRDGRPRIAGVDLLELAREHGTPLYVMDEATIRTAAQTYRDTLKEVYPGESLPLYACKANMNLGLCKLMDQEQMGLDVVSGGELYTAIQAKFPMERIFFNGNNKTIEEIELAVHHRVGRITVDNFYELELIHQVASQKKCKVPVLLRITPGIECHTHDYIKTGHSDSKFGFDMADLAPAVDRIVGPYQETIELKGLHAHVGSQIFEIQPYIDLAEILLNIFYNIREAYSGLTLTDLNLGGGLGIQYTNDDDPPYIPKVLERISEKVQQYTEQLGYPLPRLLVEPGRSMVATAGVTLYTLGSRKVVPKVRTYLAVDGGMGDNIRPALYQAEYSAVVASKLEYPAEEMVTIAGKYCESGDVLIQNLAVPKVIPGDILLVFGTGAYNYSMASNYNRLPRPGMVLLENGHVHQLVRRETYDTLIQQDVIPSHLMGQLQPLPTPVSSPA